MDSTRLLDVTSTPERPVEAFLTASWGDLVALAYVLTGSRDAAEDAVQEVSVRLLSARVDHVEDLKAYARRAVVHECSTRGRRLVRDGRRGRSLRSEWERELRAAPDPYGRVEVLSALAALSTRQRTAVVLRYYLALTDEQIAETLGCAPATVRSLLSRAMPVLRRELDDHEGAEHD